MKIIFSDIAIKSLQEIIVFLDERWSAKELQVFHKDLEKLIQSFQDKLISYPLVKSDSQVRFALIGKKQVKVYFDCTSDRTEILLFLPSKGDPERIIRYLNN
jgi:plasmid stabilization system protein ParE